MSQFIAVIFSFVFAVQALAYTQNRGASGIPIKWQDGTQNLEFVFYANNATEDLIFSQIASEWSSSQDISITTTYSSGTPSDNENAVYYSNNPMFFGGGGIAAVTNVTYDYVSGKIIDADILINDSMTYTTDPLDGNYIGDVLSHELGHALGLAHSEVKHATMFYWLTRGQHSLSSDDKAGAYATYPDMNLGVRGKIAGKIEGAGIEKKGVPIFGAHVQAISEKTGEVVASTISLENGKFEIAGLPVDDSYYLYVSPLKVKSSMPDYYADVRDDFCTSGSSYRGAFYQTCNSSDRGSPQGIQVSSSNPTVSAGTISIRCQLDVPAEYLSQKETTFELPTSANYPGGSMVGYITPDQLSGNGSEYLGIDLSQFDPMGQSNLYLEFKLTYQSLYSVMHLKTEASRDGLPVMIEDKFGASNLVLGESEVLDSDGNPVLDRFGRIQLSTLAAVNNFELIITPQTLESWKTEISSSEFDQDYYSQKALFEDPLTFYFLTYRVVQKVGPNYVAYAGANHTSISDNKQCLDAPYAYSIVANVDQSVEVKPRRSSGDDGGSACGSVDLNAGGGNGGSGFLSFLLGLIMLTVLGRKGAGRNHLV